MILDHIMLILFGYSGKTIPENIARDVEHEFSLPVVIKEDHLDLSEFYDFARRHYNGNMLLHTIETEFASDNQKPWLYLMLICLFPSLHIYSDKHF